MTRENWLAGEDSLLKDADLAMADLQNANLDGTKLQNANLYGALLEGARFGIINIPIQSFSGDIPTEFTPTRIYPKTDWTNATLPDGTKFTGEMDSTTIYRFTKPSHPEFEAALATIKTIRKSNGLDDSDNN